MTIEQFSQSDFEKVLDDANLKWYDLDWLPGDEHGYNMIQKVGNSTNYKI